MVAVVISVGTAAVTLAADGVEQVFIADDIAAVGEVVVVVIA